MIIIDVILLELIIGKQPPVPEVGATEAQNRFNRKPFSAHSRTVPKNTSGDLLDDLQWADSATLEASRTDDA